jgi:hypothetical protein
VVESPPSKHEAKFKPQYCKKQTNKQNNPKTQKPFPIEREGKGE